MKRKELKIHPGGLMRCCTASADEWRRDDPDAEVDKGQLVACKYENKLTMKVLGDTIRWVHAPTPGVEP